MVIFHTIASPPNSIGPTSCAVTGWLCFSCSADSRPPDAPGSISHASAGASHHALGHPDRCVRPFGRRTACPAHPGPGPPRPSHALIMAAVLIRDRLRVISCPLRPATTSEGLEETLTVFFTLLRTAAEPDTLTEGGLVSIAAHTVRRLHAHAPPAA